MSRVSVLDYAARFSAFPKHSTCDERDDTRIAVERGVSAQSQLEFRGRWHWHPNS